MPWHMGWCNAVGSDERGCDCTGPARVLAECEAKRQIVAAHADDHKFCGDEVILEPGAPCDTLLTLAAVYADHPDYRDEWRP